MVVTTEVCDEDPREVQHVRCKASGLGVAEICKLNAQQYPRREKEKAEMRKVPYALAVGSLMYAMVGMTPDTTFAMGAVSRYMSNPRRVY